MNVVAQILGTVPSAQMRVHFDVSTRYSKNYPKMRFIVHKFKPGLERSVYCIHELLTEGTACVGGVAPV